MFIIRDGQLAHMRFSALPGADDTYKLFRGGQEVEANAQQYRHFRTVLGLADEATHALIAETLINEFPTVFMDFSLAELMPGTRHPKAPSDERAHLQDPTTQLLAGMTKMIYPKEIMNSGADAQTARETYQLAERAITPGKGVIMATLKLANQSWIKDYLGHLVQGMSSWYHGADAPLRYLVYGAPHLALEKPNLLLRKDRPTTSEANTLDIFWNVAAHIRPQFELRGILLARAHFENFIGSAPRNQIAALRSWCRTMYTASEAIGNNLFVHLHWDHLANLIRDQVGAMEQLVIAQAGSTDPRKRPREEHASYPRKEQGRSLNDQIRAAGLCIRYNRGIPHDAASCQYQHVRLEDLQKKRKQDASPKVPANASTAASNPSVSAAKPSVGPKANKD